MSTAVVEKAKPKRNLPTLKELMNESALENAFTGDMFNTLMCQPPPAKWVKEHPYIKGHLYLPIDKVEFLLRKVFREYRIEITGQGSSFNGVWVTVRVHYRHPLTGEWGYHDGIGSIQLQTKKGTSPADLANINQGALSMAYPLAKTLAIKDACDMFGDLFGANLNRRDVQTFKPDESIAEEIDRKHQRALLLIAECDNIADLKALRRELGAKYHSQINQKAEELIYETRKNTSISTWAINDERTQQDGNDQPDSEGASDRDLFAP